MPAKYPVAKPTESLSSLDLEASVPVENELAGFVVNTMPKAHRDYIPSKAVQKQRASRAHAPKSHVDDEPVVVEAVEFRSHADTVKSREKRESQVETVAQEILATYAQQVATYERAKSFVEKATPEQLENPDKRLKAAMRVVEKGAPITHEQAVQKARKQILRNFF